MTVRGATVGTSQGAKALQIWGHGVDRPMLPDARRVQNQPMRCDLRSCRTVGQTAWLTGKHRSKSDHSQRMEKDVLTDALGKAVHGLVLNSRWSR